MIQVQSGANPHSEEEKPDESRLNHFVFPEGQSVLSAPRGSSEILRGGQVNGYTGDFAMSISFIGCQIPVLVGVCLYFLQRICPDNTKAHSLGVRPSWSLLVLSAMGIVRGIPLPTPTWNQRSFLYL